MMYAKARPAAAVATTLSAEVARGQCHKSCVAKTGICGEIGKRGVLQKANQHIAVPPEARSKLTVSPRTHPHLHTIPTRLSVHRAIRAVSLRKSPRKQPVLENVFACRYVMTRQYTSIARTPALLLTAANLLHYPQRPAPTTSTTLPTSTLSSTRASTSTTTAMRCASGRPSSTRRASWLSGLRGRAVWG